MSIMDEIAAETKSAGPTCGVCRWIDASPDREEWIAAFADPLVGTSAGHRVMARKGFEQRLDSVKKHRAAGHQGAVSSARAQS